MLVLLRRENRKRERGLRNEVIEGVYDEHAKAENGCFESVEAALREKGDAWSGFKYTL
jgi:hypothetical protein